MSTHNIAKTRAVAEKLLAIFSELPEPGAIEAIERLRQSETLGPVLHIIQAEAHLIAAKDSLVAQKRFQEASGMVDVINHLGRVQGVPDEQDTRRPL